MASLNTFSSPPCSPTHLPLRSPPPLATSFHGLSLPTPAPPLLSTHVKHRRSTPSAALTNDCLLSSSQPSFYDLLGVSQDVTLVDIKQAYRQMARKYHPDVVPANRSEESTRRFIEIQEAYEVLSDPRSRALYDRAIATGLGTVGRSWDVEDKEFQMGHWRSHWTGQLDGLKRRSAAKANDSESWAAKMRRQREQMYDTV